MNVTSETGRGPPASPCATGSRLSGTDLHQHEREQHRKIMRAALEAAIALMRGQSEWISVKDDTPPEDVPVWCLTKGDRIFIGGYVYIDEGWGWTNCYTSIYHTLKDGKWVWKANTRICRRYDSARGSITAPPHRPAKKDNAKTSRNREHCKLRSGK